MTQPVSVNALAQAVGGTSQERPVDRELLEAARQFEAVFVRQMLQSAGMAGMDTDSGYGAMALDSLAKTITEGDGIGLGRLIESMLRETDAGTGIDVATPEDRTDD